MCAVLCMCCVSAAGRAEEPVETNLYAGCMLKITADPAVFPVTIDNIAFLIRKTTVGQKPLDELLEPGIPADEVIIVKPLEPLGRAGDAGQGGGGLSGGMGMMGRGLGGMEMGGGFGGGMGGGGDVYGEYSPYGTGRSVSSDEAGSVTVFIHLAVDLQAWLDYSGKGNEALHAVIENLRHVLEDASLRHRAAVERQARVVEEETLRAEEELAMLQASLRDLTGLQDLSRRAIMENMGVLRGQFEAAVREQAAFGAMTDAIGKQLADTRAQLDKEISEDIVLKELERLLQMSVQQEENVRKMIDSGRASTSSSTEATEKTLRARIELAKRKEELARHSGLARRITEVTNELSNLSVKVARLDAEVPQLRRQVVAAGELFEKADAYERQSLKLDLVRRNLQEALALRDRTTRRLRTIPPPEVVVMGAD